MAEAKLMGAPPRHLVSLAVTWMPSLKLWCMKGQKSGQVYHTVLPGKAYFSCQVSGSKQSMT